MNYQDLINPTTLFCDIEEVKEFVKIDCSITDLECFLDACEKEELYEYCVIIKREIDDRFNQNRTGNRSKDT